MKSMKSYTKENLEMSCKRKSGKSVLYGTAKIGEKGQIVIPSEARKEFGLKPGDAVIIMGKKGKGLGIAKSTIMNKFLSKVFSDIVENEE